MNEKQNTKVVQEIYAAYQRNDIPGILSRVDERIVFTVPGTRAVPMSGTRRGHEGLRQFFADLANTQDFNVFEPREYICQNSQVIALVHYEGRHRSTGRRFSVDSAMHWTIENGKAVRFQEYTDTEALAAAATGSAATA